MTYNFKASARWKVSMKIEDKTYDVARVCAVQPRNSVALDVLSLACEVTRPIIFYNRENARNER